MDISAKARYVRFAPSKGRLVINAVRRLPAERAIGVLTFLNKGASKPVLKLLQSAIANAKNNFGLVIDNLYIKEIKIDQAPVMKRVWPRGQGRADQLRKRMSHITLTLGEKR
ncbi:MAG: 50S ribosomal protein L22 [bacterium]